MSRWPGEPGWDSESYWMGVATTLAFLQADHDTEDNYDKGNRDPALRNVRLPFAENPEPEDLDRFGAAVSQLNEDCSILFWRHVKTDHGEHYVDFVSTEGHIGTFDFFFDREGWRW